MIFSINSNRTGIRTLATIEGHDDRSESPLRTKPEGVSYERIRSVRMLEVLVRFSRAPLPGIRPVKKRPNLRSEEQ